MKTRLMPHTPSIRLSKGNAATTTAADASICDFLPVKVKNIVQDMVKTQFLNRDYLAASMLSAAATAIGNALRVRIFSNWVANPALYIVLVGRAGIGKSAPMKNALKPVYDHDYAALLKYRSLTPAQKKTSRLTQTVVNDFTPEALIRAHQYNDRGVVVAVDEILGMFSSANRYNASPLIEQLLSAYSGMPLKVSRVSDPEPVVIPAPAINIIGSVQTRRLDKILKPEYMENGLIDRFQFVYPVKEEDVMWQEEPDTSEADASAAAQWGDIVDRLMSLPCDIADPCLLDFDAGAWETFSRWRNVIISNRRATAPDNTRPDKQPLTVAKIALVIHALRWASGETESVGSITSADILAGISISAWLENSFARISSSLALSRGTSTQRDILDLLDTDFKTADAAAVGSMLGMNERTVYRTIDRMIKDGLVSRVSLGCYRKTATGPDRDILDLI